MFIYLLGSTMEPAKVTLGQMNILEFRGRVYLVPTSQVKKKLKRTVYFLVYSNN